MYGERILKEIKRQLLKDKQLIPAINKMLKESPWRNGRFGGASYFTGFITRIEANENDVKIYVKYKDKEVTVEELFEKEAGVYSPTRAREVYILPFRARMKWLIRRSKEEERDARE